ncbi:MAG TPA: GntR family transcriptional regulator [Pseudonocardia sp.]|nr:GntR family transcriptional regulator [Pseudonocardia sp.]
MVEGRRTRWSEIAEELTTLIAAGDYPVGTDLPTESELCTRYDVSRFTVREALRSLIESGLISRRHGSGSRVIAATPPRSYALGVESETDVLRYAAETSMTLTGRTSTVAAAIAGKLGLDDPGEWLGVSGIRTVADGTRIGLVEVYLRKAHAPVLDQLDTPLTGAIFGHLLRHYQLTLVAIEQKISAIALKPAQARRLNADPGQPALRIERRYLTAEAGLVEVSVTTHPADRFEYSLRIDTVRAPLRRSGAGSQYQPG